MEMELVGRGPEIHGYNSSSSTGIRRQDCLRDIGARIRLGTSGGIFPVDLLLEQVTELGRSEIVRFLLRHILESATLKVEVLTGGMNARSMDVSKSSICCSLKWNADVKTWT